MEIRVYIGVIGSGKDYSAKKECDLTIAFADSLREDIFTILGWKPQEDEYTMFKSTSPLILNKYSCHTGREIMQIYTDLIKVVKSSYFTDKLISKLDEMLVCPEYSDKIIGITDCRFDYEIKALVEFSIVNGIQVKFIHCNF